MEHGIDVGTVVGRWRNEKRLNAFEEKNLLLIRRQFFNFLIFFLYRAVPSS